MPKELIEQHLPEAVNRVTGAGLGVTWLSASWSWLGNNQSSIASLCAIIGLCVTVYGVFWRKK